MENISEFTSIAMPGQVTESTCPIRNEMHFALLQNVGNINQLQAVIESQNGGIATFVEAVPVNVTSNADAVLWEGVVAVFDMDGTDVPNATRAYAWSSPIEGSNKRRFFAVLHLGAICSARKAVRAVLAAERRYVGKETG